MSVYGVNALKVRIDALEERINKLEGMAKRNYAFMKACERDGMVPKGWTIDNGNGGQTFAPFGRPRFSSGAAAPDELLLRQVQTSPRPDQFQHLPDSPISNNNNDPHAAERAILKKMRTEAADARAAATKIEEL